MPRYRPRFDVAGILNSEHIQFFRYISVFGENHILDLLLLTHSLEKP